MKANWKRTLLSLVLCAGFVWPAGAVSTGQPAASQTGTSTAQSKPAAYTVKKMGLVGSFAGQQLVYVGFGVRCDR